MEARVYSTLFILLVLLNCCSGLSPLQYHCPSSSGTLVSGTIVNYSDQIKVSATGDIALTNQQTYCYTVTLPKRFSKSPNVAVALNKFATQSTNNFYLSVKPVANINNRGIQNSQSLTTISFSLNLYQLYTRWTMIEFYFLAQDRVDVEAGYLMVDAGVLGRCDTGKSINALLPFRMQMAGQVEAFVFLNGFEISAKSAVGSDKFSPLQVQLLNKRVNSTGISLTVSVTSATVVHSLLISYVAFQQSFGKIYGGSYTFENYDQFPTAAARSASHSPQVLINQLWARINGLSGFIINSNPNELTFDAGDFTSVYNIKINNFWKYFSYEYVFFMGGLCSDCEGFNIYYLGQCLKECPPQTIFNGYTCIQCAQNQVWNGTHCINRCSSGRIFLNGNCVCPDNTEWNTFSCIACTGGKVWNSLSRTCPCPTNSIWNGFSCITCDGGRFYDANAKECICPLGSNWNGFSCAQACPHPRFWNSTIQQCQCQVNLIWNGTNCIPCTGGRQYNSFSRQCECLTGTWNGISCFSSSTCQGGMIWNSLLRICECPKRTYPMNGGCIACGSLPGDNVRSECRCSVPNSFWNGIDCTVCDKQRIFDPFFGTCTCPAGQQWNGIECLSGVCPKGYEQFGKSCFCPLNMNEINGQCVASSSCSGGMMWNNILNKCQPISCQQGTYWDGEKCVSSTNGPTNNCPFSTYWNGFFCASFSDTCPAGTEWTGDFCQTTEKRCQPGMYWTGSTCAVIPSQCPAQLVWNDQQNRCVPSNNVCPSGTYFNGFSCMPYSGCKNGQIWSNALVQCVCPENSFWNGGNCVPCVGGMLYGASGCYCPLGTFFNGTACSKVATKECSSIAYSVLNGQICDCLPGFDKVEESCICTGVVIGLNFCDKCTLKPNSQWNGIICQCNSDYVEVLGRCKPKSETTNPTGVVPANRPRSRCSVGTFFDAFEQKCQLCSDGCLSCKDCYQCQQCRPEYTFHAATKTCLEICGDGKRFSLQCDDGNNANGDGCSSDCKIEPEYTCSAGSPNSKDLCSKFKPEKIQLKQTGQTRLFGKILMNVRLNYLPTNLTLNIKECNQSCDKILLVKLTEGQRTFLSINAKYIRGSSYSFSVEIDFGREPVGQFTAEISINKDMQERYFSGININDTLVSQINPAFLALVKREDRI